MPRKLCTLLIATGICVVFMIGLKAAPASARTKIGICFTAVGPGDLSFNNMLYKGSIELQDAHDVEIVYRTTASDTEQEFKTVLSDLAGEKRCDLVLTLGFQARTAIDAVAPQYPETHFVLFDVPAQPAPNVSSVVYAQHEGSFVVGVFAARMTTTKTIGLIGGVDIDILKAIEYAFREGIAYVDPSITLLVEYCSRLPDFSGFSSPQKGYDLANAMFAKGADIIFGAAGGSGPGIIQAAIEQRKYVIGTDANQDYMAPGLVLTSMMKRLDLSMIDICEKFIRSELQGNQVYEYGYHNGGISLSPMEFTKENIPSAVLNEIQEIEQKIMNGSLRVTNTLQQSTE